jgi:hypothetical protein
VIGVRATGAARSDPFRPKQRGHSERSEESLFVFATL